MVEGRALERMQLQCLPDTRRPDLFLSVRFIHVALVHLSIWHTSRYGIVSIPISRVPQVLAQFTQHRTHAHARTASGKQGRPRDFDLSASVRLSLRRHSCNPLFMLGRQLRSLCGLVSASCEQGLSNIVVATSCHLQHDAIPLYGLCVQHVSCVWLRHSLHRQATASALLRRFFDHDSGRL